MTTETLKPLMLCLMLLLAGCGAGSAADPWTTACDVVVLIPTSGSDETAQRLILELSALGAWEAEDDNDQDLGRRVTFTFRCAKSEANELRAKVADVARRYPTFAEVKETP